MEMFIFIQEFSQPGMSGYEFLALHSLQATCIPASMNVYLQLLSKLSTVCNFCKTCRSAHVFIWYEFSPARRTAHCRMIILQCLSKEKPHTSLHSTED